MRWIIATRNRGKIVELAPMLAAHGIDAIGLDDAGVTRHAAEDAVECFDTCAANALAKAQYFAGLTGQPCIADDSGLCIDALDGRPGVRSRRFARDEQHAARPGASEDDANNEAMLDACWDSGWAPPWSAQFVCAAAFADSARSTVAEGSTLGTILPDPTGHGGFGYDPYFVSAELGVSFAVASREAKASVSHRARAVAVLLARVVAADSDTSGR